MQQVFVSIYIRQLYTFNIVNSKVAIRIMATLA